LVWASYEDSGDGMLIAKSPVIAFVPNELMEVELG
jgi:hypothetical protein